VEGRCIKANKAVVRENVPIKDDESTETIEAIGENVP